jgi:hypothetical protein
MTLNDTMQHYTTVYKTIQHYNYKAIWHHMTPYNVIQDYTTIYKAIRHCTTLYNVIQDYMTLCKTIQHHTIQYNTILHYRRLLYKTIETKQHYTTYTRLYDTMQHYISFRCFPSWLS